MSKLVYFFFRALVTMIGLMVGLWLGSILVDKLQALVVKKGWLTPNGK